MSEAEERVDVVIVGAGHNGLVCAGYLARKGLRVKVVERRGVVGGAAVTEEFHPGFRNSVCSYAVSLLNPKVIRELELARYGLEVRLRPISNFSPLAGGDYLKLTGQYESTRAEIARHSEKDAAALAGYYEAVEGAADALRDLVLKTPPNAGGGWREALRAALIGNRLRKLSLPRQRDLAEFMTKSVGDYLDGWFENAAVKGVFGFDAVVGNMVSPYEAGSAYVLLHHGFGEANGVKGAWGHAVGGMGAITGAMARSAEAHGAEIEVNAPVAEILLEKGKAAGVRLADGRLLRARAVAANVNPKLLFLDLVPDGALGADFRRRIEGWRCRSGTFRMNLALSELPNFSCLPGTAVAEHHQSGIVIAPSLGYLERAFDDARRDGFSREPIVEILLPSTLDDSLAPKGAHVASLFCQHFDPDLADGRSWDCLRDTAADRIIETVTAYAPNFKASILGRQLLSPLDLEREFGLIGGDIFHGALHLDQLFSLRPVLGHADYRAPIPALYLCGSGAHPGGGVTGVPGHNAAREMLKDFRKGRVARG